MAPVAFTWRFLDEGGAELGSSEEFQDRAGAEQWLGESWPGLLERGVQEVELIAGDGGEAVLRMSLREE